MTKTFTQNDIIRYIYKETTKTETALIESALVCDPYLMDELCGFSNLKSDLDGISKRPSESSVDKILEYSKSLNVHSV
jgi:hypothetical protein